VCWPEVGPEGAAAPTPWSGWWPPGPRRAPRRSSSPWPSPGPRGRPTPPLNPGVGEGAALHHHGSVGLTTLGFGQERRDGSGPTSSYTYRRGIPLSPRFFPPFLPPSPSHPPPRGLGAGPPDAAVRRDLRGRRAVRRGPPGPRRPGRGVPPPLSRAPLSGVWLPCRSGDPNAPSHAKPCPASHCQPFRDPDMRPCHLRKLAHLSPHFGITTSEPALLMFSPLVSLRTR